MTTVLRPGVERILAVFAARREERIHLRELARATKLHGQSITRYLRQLEKERILVARKEGNLKQYALAKNPRTAALLALFDVERTERMPLLRKNAINVYLAALPRPPLFAILFGSTAKGSYRDDSDIDILLITHAKIDASRAEKEADAQCAMRVSTFQMTYDHFLKELKLREEPVIQSAIKTGYPLINHVSYYGVVRDERV